MTIKSSRRCFQSRLWRYTAATSPIVIARVLDETPVFTYKGAIPDACFRLNSLQTWFAGFRGKRQNHI